MKLKLIDYGVIIFLVTIIITPFFLVYYKLNGYVMSLNTIEIAILFMFDFITFHVLMIGWMFYEEVEVK